MSGRVAASEALMRLCLRSFQKKSAVYERNWIIWWCLSWIAVIAPEIVPLLVKGNQLSIMCVSRGPVKGYIVEDPKVGEGGKAG
jgi:hypothetical protein